ncbi:MAG: efflux RND transporter periplasmic adaptor subunit [Chlamydiales bacterium]
MVSIIPIYKTFIDFFEKECDSNNMIHPMYLILFITLMISSCEKEKKQENPLVVTAFRITKETMPADFQFVGVAKSSHPVEIRSRVEGYLATINYQEGEMVAKDQLLFRIDPIEFETNLEDAKGKLAKEEAILWRAQRSLARLEPLYEQNAVSQRDRDNALAQVLAAEASVISARANVAQAELNLSYTYITSPIQGLTGQAYHREGALIIPTGESFLTLVSVIDPIWVIFSISDNQLLEMRGESQSNLLLLPEQEDYTVTLQLSDGSFFSSEGRVNFESPTFDPHTGSLFVRSQFNNPNGTILPGQFVNAIVSGAKWNQVMVVPQVAVSQGRKGMFVFIINQNQTVSRREVKVGPWYKNYWMIEEGLEPGDLVIVDGVNKVKEDSTVQITSIDSLSGF